jgi:hypothetical protein
MILQACLDPNIVGTLQVENESAFSFVLKELLRILNLRRWFFQIFDFHYEFLTRNIGLYVVGNRVDWFSMNKTKEFN